MSQNKKFTKRLLVPIITAAVVLVFLSAILIINIFIPFKYLSAYINFGADKSKSGELRISFIDVGDGDCTLVELPDGKTALFDGGNGSYTNQLKIFKKLNSCKINKIDYLFCTSSEDKRCGGLDEIVKYKKVDKIFAPLYKNDGVTDGYRSFMKETKKKDKLIAECTYGAGAYSEEYDYCLYVLYPEASMKESEYDNARSSSVWISYGGVNVLLLGDLSTSELYDFLNIYTTIGLDIDGRSINLEDCNIVKAANGGRGSSTCAPLYDLIQAETAIISTAKEPALALISDIESYAGSNIYRTDKDGTVTISISSDGYTVKKEK